VYFSRLQCLIGWIGSIRKPQSEIGYTGQRTEDTQVSSLGNKATPPYDLPSGRKVSMEASALLLTDLPLAETPA